MAWIKATGKLVYDPERIWYKNHKPVSFKKESKARTLMIELPRSTLDLYYQWFLVKKYGQAMVMQRPMWGLHVTIVSGNEHRLIPNEYRDLWGKHTGMVDFEYSNEIENHWKFWVLPVRGNALDEYRRELGLRPTGSYHITVARQFDWQPALESEFKQSEARKLAREMEV